MLYVWIHIQKHFNMLVILYLLISYFKVIDGQSSALNTVSKNYMPCFLRWREYCTKTETMKQPASYI